MGQKLKFRSRMQTEGRFRIPKALREYFNLKRGQEFTLILIEEDPEDEEEGTDDA